MADGIYVAMSAAAARAAQLDAVADNLANAQTPGFRASRPAFQAFGLPGGGRDTILAGVVETGVDLRPGVTLATERPLDVIPDEDRFLAVATSDGTRAYTRNGHLEISADGDLLIAGNQVLDSQGSPISVPPGAVPEVMEDGEVVADGTHLGRLGMYRLEGTLSRSGDSLLILSPDGSAVDDEEGQVRVGELELGNAPPLEATIQMIGAQRHFDTAMQAIATYRKVDERAIEVGKIR